MYILGYHVSINRRTGLVLPDQGIITEKLNSQKKQKPRKSRKAMKLGLPSQPPGSDGFPHGLEEVLPLLATPGRSSMWI